MKVFRLFAFVTAALAGAGCRDANEPGPAAIPTSNALALAPGASQVAAMYFPDFVSTAATGYDLNDAGDVAGRSYRDTGCGSFCLPPEDIVVWRGGNRLVLPLVPGFPVSYHFPFYINNQGLLAGEVGYPGATTHAAVWRPSGATYAAQDLGVFPGTSMADVNGLDELGRMVGWSTLGGAIPSLTIPFMWSQATGFVNLKAQGFPNERPAALSPNGAVVTWNFWYRLGSPSSVRPLPPTPAGFGGAGSNGSAINDAGDQAHILASVNTQNLRYPFRLPNGGNWQMISNLGTGRLSRYGIGSINAALDVTFTALSTGMIAPGPSGQGQPLTALVSPAYPGVTIHEGGPMNGPGMILSRALIGRSERVVKLTPVVPCGSNCIIVSSLAMTGQFVQDPAFPGSCIQGGKMHNLTTVTATVTSETGAPLANVVVNGRFLDDYWTNNPVSGTTNGAGVVKWTYKGPCGVGAVAFLVDGATLSTRRLDRTRGRLTNFVIPGITPPTNQPPIAAWTVSCQPPPAHVCTFNGTGSSDPDGTVVGYRWTNGAGTLLSTAAVFTKTFPGSGTRTWTLTVTDNGGKTGTLTKTFTIP